MEERWRNAKRVSLMAVGCSSVVTRFHPLIKKKLKEGTTFRFLAIDPYGESSKDFADNKLNTNANGEHVGFLKQNYEQMVELIGALQREGNQGVEYRLTSAHITFTMHWVECENDEESYIYVEYLPIYASNVLQDAHSAVVIKRKDTSYQFYVEQFNECWQKSKSGIERAKVAGCEFCYPPQEDDKYILIDTKYWRIYLANNQNYPGRCIIPLHRHCGNLSEITYQELEDFQMIVKMLETIWREELGATNFNWTCLMNGGYAVKPYKPHVHFHFIPRYDHVYKRDTEDFIDTNFGDHYELSDEFQLNVEERAELCARLKKRIAEYISGDVNNH
jgi:diadenosine tetraphosphate (Ap4A) HIT family hydrolase